MKKICYTVFIFWAEQGEDCEQESFQNGGINDRRWLFSIYGVLLLLVIIAVVIAVVSAVSGAAAAIADDDDSEEE